MLSTVYATGAQHIGVTHGYTATLVRYLNEQGFDAFVMPTRFEGNTADDQHDDEENHLDAAENRTSAGTNDTANDTLANDDAHVATFTDEQG